MTSDTPRIPLADPATLTGRLAKIHQLSPTGKLDVFRLMTVAPACAEPYLRYMQATVADLGITQVERELVVLAVAALEGGSYIWAQHCQIGTSIGIDQPRLDALGDGFTEQGPFDDREWALLDFVRGVIRDVRVSDARFAATRAHFTPQQIVEIIYLAGAYMTLVRLTEVAELPVDQLLGDQVFNYATSLRK